MSKQILIIDDEPAIVAIIQASLEILGGWEVLTASTAQEGLSKAQSQKPDAILLDLIMPDVNGLTVLEKLHSQASTQQIPVILMTAKGEKYNNNQYCHLGLAGVILKPFDPLELVKIIEQILAAHS